LDYDLHKRENNVSEYKALIHNNLQDFNNVTGGAKLYSTPVSDINIHPVDFSATPDMQQRWDHYVMDSDLGSVFHTTSWLKLIQSSFTHRPFHLVAETPTGKISGVLPLFLVRSRIFGRIMTSTPQAAYGGILADNDSVSIKLFSEAKKLAQEKNVRFLELRNLHASETLSLITKDLYVTFKQELADDPEKNFSSIPRKTRAECRQGIKNGLEFKVNEIGVDDFYKVYSRSVRDLGTPVFSKRLFANGLQEFGDKCKIISVHWQDKLVSSVWTLFYKDEILPYYGGAIREYNRLGVNNFMYWMLIKYGCENGYRVFDFGRSKKGTGSFNFKKRWGMDMKDLPYQYYLVRQKSLPDTSPLNPKFSLSIRLWQKLPLPIANTFGPFIAKHLI
jgi:FemAB-related protein (PEP-CTERM system-associated)